jgi:hypothetical protein
VIHARPSRTAQTKIRIGAVKRRRDRECEHKNVEGKQGRRERKGKSGLSGASEHHGQSDGREKSGRRMEKKREFT